MTYRIGASAVSTDLDIIDICLTITMPKIMKKDNPKRINAFAPNETIDNPNDPSFGIDSISLLIGASEFIVPSHPIVPVLLQASTRLVNEQLCLGEERLQTQTLSFLLLSV